MSGRAGSTRCDGKAVGIEPFLERCDVRPGVPYLMIFGERNAKCFRIDRGRGT